MAPLAIVIPAPINHAYWRQLMKGDYIDIISNCPYEMHNSLSDEDYPKIIYDLKDDHKELIYFLLRYEEEIPTTMKKLNKEKLAREESKKRKKITERIVKKKFKNAYRHAMIVIVFIRKELL